MKLALFDIDGTLANDSHRVQFAVNKQWATYFEPERMLDDRLLLPGWVRLWWLRLNGWSIQYLTGRREDRREVTVRWLHRKWLPAGTLHMRSFTDKMPLANFKVTRMEDISLRCNYTRVMLLDDDPEVIRFVKERLGEHAGIHCRWYVKPDAMVKAAQA